MVAKKIFHVLIGFWFASKAFFIFYLIGAALYAWRTDTLDATGPIFFSLPRFAMLLSAPVPLAAGIVMWPARRYLALGIMGFGLVASVFWQTTKRTAFW
jgi:hypothetical protein